MYLLGIDIGTSSVKAAIVNADTGTCVASDFFPKQEAPIKSLRPGWAEQNPESWIEYMKQAIASVKRLAGVSAADIKAIGISYQMHGLVAIDKAGNVLHDSIIWCDSRGVPYGERAAESLGKDICLSHLLNLPGNFTASKLEWLKENEPDVFDRIYKVMLPADYAAYRLTGEIVTNPEGLSEYMLWDFKEDAPAEFLMDFWGFPHDIFPEVLPTFSNQGTISAAAAAEFGLAAGTPITYRAGDQPNNAVSLNVFNPGEIASTAGTSGVVYGIIGSPDYDSESRVNNFAHVNHTSKDNRIGVMTCINGTGCLNSWLKRNIASDCSYSDMNELAASIPAGSEGVTILPFGNGAERILHNRDIGCSIHYVNFNIHTRKHILRAAQEGIVFSFMYGMEIMNSIGLDIKRIHAGHANMFLSPVFRQTLANVSGAVIELLDTDGAAGAAKAAGIGAGIYKDNKEAFETLKHIAAIEPVASDINATHEAYLRWKDTLTTELTNKDNKHQPNQNK